MLAVFAPTWESGLLAFDLVGREVWPELAEDDLLALDVPVGHVRLDDFVVRAERSAFHAIDDSPSSTIEERFPLTWRVEVAAPRCPPLPASSDGPFLPPKWLVDGEVARSLDAVEWSGWPAEVTVVGSFVVDRDEAIDHGHSACSRVVPRSRPSLSVSTTGAGLHQVRIALDIPDASMLDELAGPVLAALDDAGALVHRSDHQAFLAALT